MIRQTTAFIAIALGLAGVAGTAIAAEPRLPRVQKFFERIDADKDGKVTLAEFAPVAEKRFLREDANKDGQITAAEIDEAMKRQMERRRDMMMAAMDTDKNGTISKLEFDQFLGALMKGADSNADGGVSLDEARMFKFGKWRKSQEGTGTN
jgi:Ca2+-binding EF-hand superfamily protein